MDAVRASDGSRWAMAAAGAVMVLLLLLALFRAPTPPAALPPAERAAPVVAAEMLPVQVARPVAEDGPLGEFMALRDLQPLFLPTKYNATLPVPELEPGRTFLDNEALKFSFAETSLDLRSGLPPPATLNGGPVEKGSVLDALEGRTTGPSLQGFGRTPVALEPLPARAAFLQVFSTTTGRLEFETTLPDEARAPAGKPWAPLELLAASDAAGLAAPLVVATGSGVEEIDVHFRNYLARTYRIGQRLPSGFYRIVVAP